MKSLSKNKIACKSIVKKQNKYTSETIIPYNPNFNSAIPNGMIDEIRPYVKRKKLLHPTITLVNYCYKNAFNKIIIPHKILRGGKWGLKSHQDTEYIIKMLLDIGFLNISRKWYRQLGQATTYEVNIDFVREIYCNTNFIYRGVDNAVRGKYRNYSAMTDKRGKNAVEIDTAAALRQVRISWNSIAAFELLLSLSSVERAKKWQSICILPSGRDMKCSWWQQGWDKVDGGRLYAYRDPWQSVPKEFRIPEIMCNKNQDLVTADFTAQHANIFLGLQGVSPNPNLWLHLSSRTGTNKNKIKKVINPYLSGESLKGCVSRMQKQGDLRSYQEISQERRKIISAFLSLTSGKCRSTNTFGFMQLGSRIMHRILCYMHEIGLHCLSLHDGVITQETGADFNTLTNIFRSASYETLGFSLPVH